MNVKRGISEAIGNTPLIELPKLSAAIGRRILGKAEFLNPGGSVKDRAARGIIDDAEAAGRLQSGGTIVEGTAGNTGIAIALLANARGYRAIIVVPDDQSPEKIGLLHTFGADVRVVPAVPFGNPDNYYHVAKRIAQEIPGAVWADQFDNVANRRAHYATTGPEIWEAVGSELTAFVAACGTGGTLAGTSLFLKERDPSVRVALCDPYGSALYAFVKTGELAVEGDSNAEGIGIKRITQNFAGRARRRRGARGRPHDGRDGRVADARRRPLPRRFGGAQRRGSGAFRSHARTACHGRHDPVRRRRSLPLENLERRMARRKRLHAARNGPLVLMRKRLTCPI